MTKRPEKEVVCTPFQEPECMSIEATKYVSKPPMLVLRAALPTDDPDSWASLWKKKYGSLKAFPYEKFGLPNPYLCRCCHGSGVIDEEEVFDD